MTTLGDTHRVEPALDELLADLRELVECESPSNDLAAVERSADLVARLGTRTPRPRAGAHRGRRRTPPALAARSPTAPGRVLVLAHHDTVWPLGTLARAPFTVADGVLRGPGCFDMIAGLVMALHAIADLGDARRRDAAGDR